MPFYPGFGWGLARSFCADGIVRRDQALAINRRINRQRKVGKGLAALSPGAAQGGQVPQRIERASTVGFSFGEHKFYLISQIRR